MIGSAQAKDGTDPRIIFLVHREVNALAREDDDTGRLVTRFQGGDQSAFNELYLRYFERVYIYCRTLLKDAHAAEDATQEVFVRAMTALPRFDLRGGTPFRAWIFRIARNWAFKDLRQAGRMVVEEPEAIERRTADANGEPGLDPALVDWLTDPDLLVLVERLPLIQRQVIVLRYLLGLSIEETAEVIGKSPAAIYKHHGRAMAFLKGRLRSLGRDTRTMMRPSMRRPFQQQRNMRRRRSALLGL